MFEKTIKKSSTEKIYLKYDKENYDIEYIEKANIILLRRLSDYQIIKVFSDNIGFIIQCDKDDQINFLVTDYSEKDYNGQPVIKFKHYIDNKNLDELTLKYSLSTDCVNASQCRITDSSYLVERSGYTGCIYNLEKLSKRFHEIYNDENVCKFFSNNTILVSERLTAFARHDVSDTITYGINPETFEITTPIWSELQQRYIDVYTDEKIKELAKKGIYFNIKDLDRITIYQEVEEYLEKLALQLDRPTSVYKDTMEYEVNEEFVKKFVKTNKNI